MVVTTEIVGGQLAALIIPAEPEPTTHSANGNAHRLTRVSPGVLLLEPGSKDWWAAGISLAFFPFVLGFCIFRQEDMLFTVGLSLFPLFGAAGFGVGAFCYHQFGTRARFDRDKRKVSVTGYRHGNGLNHSLDEILAVQFCDPGRWFGEGSLIYQVNLVVRSAAVTRVNLLNSGGKRPLRRMAGGIADFLGVPLYVNSDIAQ